MLPERWEEQKLGNLFEFKNGVNADKECYGSGIKFVNVMDIFANTIMREEHIKGSVEISPKQHHDFSVIYGDILFNRTSETFDEIAFASVYLDKSIVTFGGFVIRARSKSNKIDPEFTTYKMHSHNVRKEFIRRGQGAVRANIGQKDLAKIPITLPPIAEQKKIAEILFTWDRAIETTNNLIDNAKAQKKALMQQLLTRRKYFPEFSGEVWRELLLEEVFTERTERNQQNQPLLAITGKQGIIPQSQLTRKSSASEDKSKYKRIVPGDIGYNTMRMWQGVSAKSDLEGIISPAYTIISTKSGNNPDFFKYLFKLPSVVFIFRRHSQGMTSDTWNLKFPAFSKIKVRIPSLNEQSKIAEVLQLSDDEIETLQTQLTSLQEQKKALMQRILTGKRRVKI